MESQTVKSLNLLSVNDGMLSYIFQPALFWRRKDRSLNSFECILKSLNLNLKARRRVGMTLNRGRTRTNLISLYGILL